MRWVHAFIVVAVVVAVAGVASGQDIIEDFDSYTPGLPPGEDWWIWGDGGTTLVDDTVFHGSSGKTVAIDRDTFPGNDFAFGRSFVPIEDRAVIAYAFRVSGSPREMLSAFATNDDGSLVGPWVTVGFPFIGSLQVYSESLGWLIVLNVQPNTWYQVVVDADVPSNTYDITAWNEDDPTDINTLEDVPFRSSAGVPHLGTVQLGDFSGAGVTDMEKSWVDNVVVLPLVFFDGFESGDTAAWSLAVP